MNDGFLYLMQAFDSLFPIGAYTMSNGLETYVQKNIISNSSQLDEYLKSFMYVLPFNDLGFTAKAIQGYDFIKLDEICTASKSPLELRESSRKLCARFLKTEMSLGKYQKLEQYSKAIADGKCNGCYCIAVGLFISDVDADIKQGLEMYCYSMISMIVNHCVKLVPLSQTDGQKSLSKAMTQISKVCEKAINIEVDELGMGGMGFDTRAMQHEKLYSRLYIS